MFRRVIAGLFLGPALFIGSFAWSGFIATRTIFDADRSATIAQELFDDEEVRSQLAENLGSAVEAALPDDVSISSSEVETATERILANPAVERLVIEAFSATHHAFLGDGDAPRTLDLTPVASKVRSELVAAAPDLDSQLPPAAPLMFTLPTDQIPNAKPVSDFLHKAVPILAAMSVIGVMIAFLATTDRPAVLKRAALWALGTTAVYLIIGLGLPELLRRFAPDQAKVVAVFLSALLRSTLTPSIILAVVGVGLLIAGFVWPDSNRDEATAAAPRQVVVTQSVANVARPPDPWPTMPAARATEAIAPPVPSPRATAPSPPARPPEVAPPAAASPADADLPGADSLADDSPFVPTELPPRPGPAPAAPSARSVLPTRASRSEPVDLPAWTGESETPEVRPPKWVEGHGWVLDPDDPRPPPSNSRWVEGVGHVVPGPPPDPRDQ